MNGKKFKFNRKHIYMLTNFVCVLTNFIWCHPIVSIITFIILVAYAISQPECNASDGDTPNGDI